MTEEVWKDIIGYEGLYQISNMGRVKSVDRWVVYNNSVKHIQEKILKIGYDLKSYAQIVLSKNGKHKTLKVHRLVATHFIPNPDNLPCINHIDENPKNNAENNLEWCTYTYNNTYGRRIEKMVKSMTNNSKRSKPVIAMRDNKIIYIFPSIREAERNGFGGIHIIESCIGKHKQHKGYQWRYLDDYLADILEEIQYEDMRSERAA